MFEDTEINVINVNQKRNGTITNETISNETISSEIISNGTIYNETILNETTSKKTISNEISLVSPDEEIIKSTEHLSTGWSYFNEKISFESDSLEKLCCKLEIHFIWIAMT